MGADNPRSFKQVKILFILESFKRGGKERRCLQLIQGLNRQGYNDIYVIIVNNGIEYPEIYDTSAKVYIIDKKNKGLSHYSTFKQVKTYISDIGPDIVHAWGEVSMLYISILRLCRKFIYVCANIADCNKPKWYSLKKIVSSFSYFLADAVVGNSNQGLKAYSAPKNKSYCIYNGFNESRFNLVENLDQQKLRASLDVQTKYLVAMFARVDYYKDYDAFIDLARVVLRKRDDVTFLAVGGGLNYDLYKDKPYPDEKLRFIGFRSDVEQIMYSTDVSILFSNYEFHKEGVSNSILESMAFGTPVIATKDGGSPEIIDNNKNGFLVDKNNIEIAASILCKLLDDPEELSKVSKQAKDTVFEKFLLNQMVNNYIKLYANLMGIKDDVDDFK